MWKRIRGPLMWMLAAEAVAYAIGRIIERKMTDGDESSDEFKVAAICNGREFHSRAQNLRSGDIVAGLGGIEVDLRDATLDPSGAHLNLNAVMGGIQLTVPDEWIVEFETNGSASGLKSEVRSADELPEGAPRLQIHALTRMGGAVVTTET